MKGLGDNKVVNMCEVEVYSGRGISNGVTDTCPQDCCKLKEKDQSVQWILDPNNRCQRGGEKFDNR